MEPLYVAKGFLGLNTKQDQTSGMPNDAGFVYLSSCSNVDIDDGYRLVTRKGYVKVHNQTLGSLSSCFSTKNINFVVFCEGDALSILNLEDSSVQRTRNITPNLPMFFVEHLDRIYYTNGQEQGFISKDTRINSSWVMSGEYLGPKTSRVFSDPPIGTRLHVYNSRMFISLGAVVYVSEPFDVSRFVLDEGNLLFDSNISEITSTENALIISTEKAVYRFVGGDSQEFKQELIYNYPIIAKTSQRIYPSALNVEEVDPGILALSTNGIIFISNNGVVTELSETKIDIPSISSLVGASVIYDNKYICQCDVL